MKVTKRTLKSFAWVNIHNSENYNILSEEVVEKEVSHKIPIECGYWINGFPKYLKGFEDYYREVDSCYCCYRIKDPENRPNYTIKISYTLYDVEFTEKGKEIINERLKMYEKSYNRYKKLAEGV